MASEPDVKHHPLQGVCAPHLEEKDHLATILEHMVNSTVDESDRKPCLCIAQRKIVDANRKRQQQTN